MASSNENSTVPAPKKQPILQQVMDELRKTTWPTLPEAWRLTVVVLSVIVAVAIYVGVIDVVLSKLTTYFKLIK